MVPFTDPDVAVLIIKSHVRHELTGGEYAERRGQCEQVAARLGVRALRDADMDRLDDIRGELDEVLYRRARHVVTENARTLDAAQAFSASRWLRVGELMAASHASLRDDFEVSCPELDLLVDLALRLGEAGGVFGSRMTGGGFGGCTVSLVDREAVADVAEAIGREYREKSGIEPAIYLSGPARGAHVLAGAEEE
jgi:galactokinase